jgi:flagellar motor switch protein FliG
MIRNAPATTANNAVINEQTLSGPQKAAILLVMMGDEASADILKHLADDEVQMVTHEVARTKKVPPAMAEAILEEFYQLTSARDYMVRGGVQYAENMLIKAFGPETARKLMDQLQKSLGQDLATFDTLQRADPQQLAKFLHNEHPQTIALVLSHLHAQQGAVLLAALPPSIRSDVALRVANLDQISPEVITKITKVIGQKLNALGEFSREAYGGVRAVAEIINLLDSETTKEILDGIGEQDASLLDTIRHLMFVFDDILLIDPNGVKEILARADRKAVTVALKGTSEKMKTHFMQCMSQRGAELMREDMEALGPVKIKDVDAAQQQIITIIRELETEGVLNLRGAVGEQYVV